MKKLFYRIMIVSLSLTSTVFSMDKGCSKDCGNYGETMHCTWGGGSNNENDCVPCCSDGNNSIWGGSGSVGSSNGNSDVRCGDISSLANNNANFFLSQDGTLCTKSELLEATALYGNWSESKKINGKTDMALPGAQAAVAVAMKIVHLFNNGQGFYKGMGHFKNQCAMEYITKVCQLPNETHYCHKDYNLHGQPRLHFKSEDARQKAMDLIKKMKEKGNI